ncbi:hypothetical protein N7527_012144 [Penicillium freii]|nr:hypothetical protein N7527_012144 [Penicillium freii]
MTDSLSLNSSPREVLSAPRSGYTRHPTFILEAFYVLCGSWNPASYLVGRKYRSSISEFYLGAVQASQENSLIRLTLRAFDSITYPSPDPARRRKRARRERERQHNITSDTHIPSWGRVAIAKPRSGPLQNKDLASESARSTESLTSLAPLYLYYWQWKHCGNRLVVLQA